MDRLGELINTRDYTPAQLAVVAVGTSLWGIAYFAIIRNGFRKQFIEMPALVACGNIAWEFVWGFIYHPNMGPLVVRLYQMCFLLDTLIFFNLLRYGHRQMDIPELRRVWKPLCVVVLLAWVGGCYFFRMPLPDRPTGYDDVLGATSAYILQVIISTQYITLFLRVRDRSLFSVTGTWARRLGTAIITVGMFMIYPENRFLQFTGVVCVILDTVFISLLHVNALDLLLARWTPPAFLRVAHPEEQPA